MQARPWRSNLVSLRSGQVARRIASTAPDQRRGGRWRWGRWGGVVVVGGGGGDGGGGGGGARCGGVRVCVPDHPPPRCVVTGAPAVATRPHLASMCLVRRTTRWRSAPTRASPSSALGRAATHSITSLRRAMRAGVRPPARTSWHNAAALPRAVTARADSDAAHHTSDAHDVVCVCAAHSTHAALTLRLSGHVHILYPNSAAAERAQFAPASHIHGWHSRVGAAPERAIAMAGHRRCGARAHQYAAATRRALAVL